jgi:Rad3-related DNA helicase
MSVSNMLALAKKVKNLNRLNKTKCEFCPYDSAKVTICMTSDVNLTNFHLYLINAVYGSKMFEERELRLLIVDEAHEFDDVNVELYFY